MIRSRYIANEGSVSVIPAAFGISLRRLAELPAGPCQRARGVAQQPLHEVVPMLAVTPRR